MATEELPIGLPPSAYVDPNNPPVKPIELTNPRVNWSDEEQAQLRTQIDRSTGKAVDLNADQLTSKLLDFTTEILNENPYYQTLGGLNVEELLIGRSNAFGELFPEVVAAQVPGQRNRWFDTYAKKSEFEKKQLLLSRLTNLKEGDLVEKLKALVKGTGEGYVGAKTALEAGRKAFTATPATLPFVGPFAKPIAGVTVGLGTAIASSLVTTPLGEYLFPREKNLLPGEVSEIEGIRTAANILAGGPVVKDYALKATGPALMLERMRQAGPVKTTKSQRFAAFLDEMFPKTRELYEKSPGKFIASEAGLAGIAGVTVSNFELDQDPVLRTFVELGLGLTPTYGAIEIAQRGVPKLLEFYKGYSPTRVITGGALGREALFTNYKEVFNKLRRNSPENEKLLQTKEGRDAVRLILDFFIESGENPLNVAANAEKGGDWLKDLPESVLKKVSEELKLAEGAAESELTVGLRTGSPTALILENYFMNQRERLKAAKDPVGRKASLFNKNLIKIFNNTGDPRLVEVARELEQLEFTNLMVDKLSDAVDKATQSALQLSKGNTQFERIDEISTAQAKALEQQFDYANAISISLYEAARKAGDIPNVQKFFDSDGVTELDAPLFIKKWDDLLKQYDEETLKTFGKDKFFSEIQNTVNRMKTELDLEGSPAANPAQLKLENMKESEEFSKALGLYERIVNGDVNFAKGKKTPEDIDRLSNPPEITVSDAGIPIASRENIENIQILLDDFFPELGSGRQITDSRRLLKAQKEALIAELKQASGDLPREGIAFSSLVNLGKRLTSWRADSRRRGDDLYGIASKMKQALFEDINNSVPTETSSALRVARSFYRGFGDAIKRSIAGIPAGRKGYDERLMDPESFARSYLTGSDATKATKLKALNNGSEYLRSRAEELLPEDTEYTYRDANDEEVTVNLRQQIQDNVNTVSGLTLEVLNRDIIAPLKKKLDTVTEQYKNDPPEESTKKIAEAVRQELIKLQTRFKTDDGKALKEVLGEDFVDGLLEMDSGLDVLQKSLAEAAAFKERFKSDYSFGRAINSKNPYVTVKSAIDNREGFGPEILDDFIRDVNNVAKRDQVPKNFNKEEALEGLTGSIFQYVFESAGGNANFNPQKAGDVLFEQGQGFNNRPKQSIADFLIKRKLIDKQSLDRYAALLKNIQQFEDGVKLTGLELSPENMSMAQELATRLMAVRLVKYIPGTRGSGLVEEQMASKFAMKFLREMPFNATSLAMEKIVKDKDLFILALKTPRNAVEKRAIDEVIKKKLGNLYGAVKEEIGKQGRGRAGLVAPRVIQSEDIIEEEPEQDIPGIDSPLVQLERSPAAPTGGASAPEPRPFVVAQLPVAQQPPAQTTSDSSGVASSPEMRARYKRDYPNDIVSSLIPDAPGQGIESLLG